MPRPEPVTRAILVMASPKREAARLRRALSSSKPKRKLTIRRFCPRFPPRDVKALRAPALESLIYFRRRVLPHEHRESLDPYPPDLAPGTERRRRAASDPLGGGGAEGARPGDRVGDEPGRPQRHRRPWRRLFALPGARDLGAGAQSAGAAGPHQHPSDRRQ